MRPNRKVMALLLVALLCLPALTACGDPTDGHLKKGNEFNEAGQYSEAVEEYKKALELDPDNVDVMVNLGVTYYQQGQFDVAIETYTGAIAISPDDADIHSNLAAAYVQQYDPEGTTDTLSLALEQYRKAIELAPDLAEAHYGLGMVYYLLGQTEKAVTALERFQELDNGTDAQATLFAQQILEQLGGQ